MRKQVSFYSKKPCLNRQGFFVRCVESTAQKSDVRRPDGGAPVARQVACGLCRPGGAVSFPSLKVERIPAGLF